MTSNDSTASIAQVSAHVFSSISGLVMLIVLFVFGRVSRSDAIIMQRTPTLDFYGNLCNIAMLEWSACLGLFLAPHVSCATAAIVKMNIGVLPLNCWVVVGVSLILASKQAHQQFELIEGKSVHNAAKLRQMLRRIALYQTLLQKKYQVLYVIGTVVFIQVPLEMVVLSRYPELLSTPFSEVSSIAKQHQQLEANAGMLYMFNTIALSIMAFNVRLVVDSLGIKAWMKALGISSIAVLIIYFIGISIIALFSAEAAQVATTLVTFVFYLNIFIMSVAIPLYQSVYNKSQQLPEDSAGGLESFLRIPKYVNAFRRHLRSEYSIENLHFWLEVEAFEKHLFDPDTNLAIADMKAIKAKAVHIYTMFLQHGSPQEVNLPSKLIQHFRGLFARIGPNYSSNNQVKVEPANDPLDWLEPCAYDMFKDAKKSVFELLKSDSFARFLRDPKNAALWTEFKQRQMEVSVIKTMNGHLDWTFTQTQTATSGAYNDSSTQQLLLPLPSDRPRH